MVRPTENEEAKRKKKDGMEKYLNLNLPPPHPLLSLLFCLW
jgi:hypothetical protein